MHTQHAGRTVSGEIETFIFSEIVKLFSWCRCENCADGFYGNPMNQTPEDCQPCACPSTSANFSPTCQLKEFIESDGSIVQLSTEFVCTNCSTGHAGDHCEICIEGFYGDPTKGVGCLPCTCGKNACDPLTGRCIECDRNTEGWKCDKCKEEFHSFDPLSNGCEPCKCSSGAVNNVCHPTSGECACKPNFSGALCDECALGHANVSLNCPPCNCNKHGSSEEPCNRASGQCLCKSNVHGLTCDECDEMFYGLPASECEGESSHISSSSSSRVCVESILTEQRVDLRKIN